MSMANIRDIMNDPEQLERLYREDSKSFVKDFERIYQEISDKDIAKFWKARLQFDNSIAGSKEFRLKDVIIPGVICLLVGFLIKLPDIFSIDMTNYLFYQKNAGIIFFSGLIIYSMVADGNFARSGLIITLTIFVISAIYINLLPDLRISESINLVFIHMPLLMWCLYGFVYTGFDTHNLQKRMVFIRYNGELAIMGAIILLAGGAVTFITLGLFNAIGIKITDFYYNYIIMTGLVCAPVIDAFILKNYQTLTNKIASVIANFFSLVVLITLVIFLVTFIISGKDPYNNRDFLLIFNIMLIAVVGLIVFSITETAWAGSRKFNELILFILALVSILVNMIALSAIFYRLRQYGLTPNRLAVLGSNILIFVNLILISINLYKIYFKGADPSAVEITISRYLPVYICWTAIVIFIFPFLLGI